MEDPAIIQLYWDRNEAAITASDRKYGPVCRSLSYQILENREDAEECVNDTWHKAWLTMPPQRPSSLRAYLTRITRNLSIDRWRAGRAKKRDSNMEVLLRELEQCVPAPISTEAVVESREITRCLEQWLLSLAREDRVLFLRRYWYGISVNDLAKELGIPSNQTAQRLFRLRNRLRRALELEGVIL